MADILSSVKWNNYKTAFFENLKTVRENSNYTDATLAVEGKFYPVHKLVMSSCSEYFSDIFESTFCKSPVIVLKDVRSHDIEALLDFMYLGEANVYQNDLESLLKTAESLRIKGIAAQAGDPTHSDTGSNDDAHREFPPPKRRRHDSSKLPSHAPSSVPSPQMTATALVKSSQTDSSKLPSHAPSSVPSPQMTATALVNYSQNLSIPPQMTATALVNSSQNLSIPPLLTYKSELDEISDVKIEVDYDEVPIIEGDDKFRKENKHDGGDIDPLGNDGSDISKTEHGPESCANVSSPGPSQQQTNIFSVEGQMPKTMDVRTVSNSNESAYVTSDQDNLNKLSKTNHVFFTPSFASLTKEQLHKIGYFASSGAPLLRVSCVNNNGLPGWLFSVGDRAITMFAHFQVKTHKIHVQMHDGPKYTICANAKMLTLNFPGIPDRWHDGIKVEN